MLNSAEHEILYTHKYKNTKKFSIFKAQISIESIFFLHINGKMPTVVGILTFMNRKISRSAELSRKFFITSGPFQNGLWYMGIGRFRILGVQGLEYWGDKFPAGTWRRHDVYAM